MHPRIVLFELAANCSFGINTLFCNKYWEYVPCISSTFQFCKSHSLSVQGPLLEHSSCRLLGLGQIALSNHEGVISRVCFLFAPTLHSPLEGSQLNTWAAHQALLCPFSRPWIGTFVSSIPWIAENLCKAAPEKNFSLCLSPSRNLSP